MTATGMLLHFWFTDKKGVFTSLWHTTDDENLATLLFLPSSYQCYNQTSSTKSNHYGGRIVKISEVENLYLLTRQRQGGCAHQGLNGSKG
jgi:hypothetical protein